MDNYILRLFITGKTARTEAAIANLRKVCNIDLKDRCQMQIIDVLENPLLAEEDKILATPTLVRVFPLPGRRLIGDLSNRQKILAGLGL